MSSGRWAAGLLLISAALLAFELLLMRLLALAYWGHFAGLVISIAMLGIASSGLFLFFRRDAVRRESKTYFSIASGFFGVAAPLAFLISQKLPFTPFLLTWSADEYGLLAARSVLFFIPFFAAGIAVGIPFVAGVLPMGRLYFWNMLGSGLPALPLLYAMNFTHPLRLLAAVAVLALGVSILCSRRLLARIGWFAAGACVIAAVALTSFRYSEYKDLPKTLLLPEARLLEERYGWDGVVQIVDSPHTRYLPGLSLNFAGTLPPSRLVFTDAGAMTLAFRAEDVFSASEFLRETPEAFSFALSPSPRMLQLYGGTADQLRAGIFNARQLQALDDSATRVAALRDTVGEAAQALIRADARQYIEEEKPSFDVIAVSLLGTHGTSTAGAASLDPSFLLTLEGCARLLDRVTPRGHALFSTWIENPAKSGVRLAALLIETLRRRGIENPAPHLLAIRSWSTLSIFVSPEPFSFAAIEALKAFCDQNSFDLVWFDGINSAETNRINVLPEESYHDAFVALLGSDRQEFIARSPFALEPPRDDRPFFNQSFRWGAVPQWISNMGLSWLPFVEWGYILHVAALVVVTLLGVFLLIVPCLLTRARPAPRSVLLFFLLGVAYMFVQIGAIYRVSQLIAHPLLAAALVLSAMLIASGAGA
ncbi:MAG: hypothetical protein H0W04_07515, partial [Chthoniobacterales bacterium]|nr:hypothetical protein [Chthoniobacterales bacterium]